MYGNYRKKQIITIVALLVIMGLSVGYAAFSSVLTIASSATVTPDSSSFNVLFSSSGSSQATNNIVGVGSNGATATNASISGTTISGLKANFTAPGQSVTYTFYAHNAGQYDAYLRNVTFGSGKSCTAGTGANADLVNAACDDINISVSVGGNLYSTDSSIYNHSLTKDKYELVEVTVSYSSNGDVADGEFNISLGDISLVYSSVDAATISFVYNIGSTGSVTFYALEGMSWKEFVDSEFNTNEDFIYIEKENYVYYKNVSAAWQVYKINLEYIYLDDIIEDNGQYGNLGWSD